MLKIGDKVNGYTIIATARKELDNEQDYVILGQKGEDHVTARMHDQSDKEWYWGHYFHYAPIDKVWDDFIHRVKKDED